MLIFLCLKYTKPYGEGYLGYWEGRPRANYAIYEDDKKNKNKTRKFVACNLFQNILPYKDVQTHVYL
jgi:hypothetical protein